MKEIFHHLGCLKLQIVEDFFHHSCGFPKVPEDTMDAASLFSLSLPLCFTFVRTCSYPQVEQHVQRKWLRVKTHAKSKSSVEKQGLYPLILKKCVILIHFQHLTPNATKHSLLLKVANILGLVDSKLALSKGESNFSEVNVYLKS